MIKILYLYEGGDKMKGSVKIPLFPTKEQEQQFKEFCGTSRFIYNMTLAYKIDCYTNDSYNCKLQDLIDYVKTLKYSEGYSWLQDIPEAIQKQSIKDMLTAYQRFFTSNNGFPKFKTKRSNKLSFYQRTDNLHLVDNTHIKITGIKEPVRIHNHIKGLSYIIRKPLNPRVKFDGKQWYLTFSYECVNPNITLTDNIVGVDLGLKDFAVTSDNTVYKNINKSKTVRKLEKRYVHLQRKLSKKFEQNKIGGRYIRTKNILRLKGELNNIQRRLNNIRDTYIHTVTFDLVKAKPKQIVIEDLNIKGMLKNRYLSKAISNQGFYKFRQYLSYKCEYWGIDLIVADRYYPSSKTCSRCDNVKKHLSLSERVYKCDNCGSSINRDLNAAINLKNYALAH